MPACTCCVASKKKGYGAVWETRGRFEYGGWKFVFYCCEGGILLSAVGRATGASCLIELAERAWVVNCLTFVLRLDFFFVSDGLWFTEKFN